MAFQDMHQLDGVKNADSFVRNLAHLIIFPTKDLMYLITITSISQRMNKAF